MSRVEQDPVEQFKRFTEGKLRGVRCPEHRLPPRVQYHGQQLSEMTISLTGCCAKLMRLANEAVAVKH